MKTPTAPLSILRPWRRIALTVLAIGAAIALIRWAAFGPGLGVARAGAITWRAPDFSLLAQASPVVLTHLGAALTALVIGAVLLRGPKGRSFHRRLGWGWVLAMTTVTVSSIFIRQVNHGGLSFLHLFTGWTAVALPLAVAAARRHRVKAHARAMTGLFVGGLVVAGAFNFVPGRLLWRVFVG